jgi:2-polyprenyl-3-methyl-5-hydroxy-6-metoxy-1,4-benzoquinol methylase
MGDEARDTDSSRPYVLGHSEREIERLKAQAQLIDPVTERFFREAGLASSARVLDVGSGAGDVAFVAATIVGSGGEVVGVDRVANALTIARARAADKAVTNVTFESGDPAEMVFDRPFDAVVGRYVLQFQKDPAAMLRKLAAHLRPGGLLVFHEIDWGGLSSFPAVPTFEHCAKWGREATCHYSRTWPLKTKSSSPPWDPCGVLCPQASSSNRLAVSDAPLSSIIRRSSAA